MTELETVIMDSIRLMRAHGELLEDETILAAHAEQVARLKHVLDDSDPIGDGPRVVLHPHAPVALLGGLGACIARLRAAAEDRQHPARGALAVQHERLLRWRDEALNDLLRAGRQ
jgi:hypothetical protein